MQKKRLSLPHCWRKAKMSVKINEFSLDFIATEYTHTYHLPFTTVSLSVSLGVMFACFFLFHFFPAAVVGCFKNFRADAFNLLSYERRVYENEIQFLVL